MNQGQDRYALQAARLLRDEQPETQSSPSERRRDAIVAAMALTIAGKARRRRGVLATGLVLAAAAAVVLLVRGTGGGSGQSAVFAVEHVAGGGGLLLRAGTTQPLAEAAVLATGDSLRTSRGGNATIASGKGTRLTLSAAGHMRIDEMGATRRLMLSSGSLYAQVAKLGQGERFVVNTPDSEVEVHGTVFGISVGDCHGTASRSTVQVSEGAVWLRSADGQILLRPGDSWATPCAPTRASPAPTAPAGTPNTATNPPGIPLARPAVRHVGANKLAGFSSSALSRTDTAGSPPAQPTPRNLTPKPEPVSHLAEQNDLFSTAMSAEHLGQHDLALRHLDDLIQRFPGGPLRESAQAEKQRILSAQTAR